MIKSFARRKVKERAALYSILRRYKRPDAAITKDTELVIEGFPRSGNTFCELAFRASQMRPLIIAHHSHAPGQVLEGVRRGLPVLLVLRDIEKSLESFSAHSNGTANLVQTIDEYIWFHKVLIGASGRFSSVLFDQLTNDFPSIVAAVKERYKINLAVPVDMPLVERRAFEMMNERGQNFFGREVGGANPRRDKTSEQILRDSVRETILNSTKLNLKLERARKLTQLIHSQSALISENPFKE